MNNEKDLMAEKVVAHMMEHDLFSQWLGISVIEVKEGYSRIRMTVRDEMINGFGIVHGGIAFSLADSAFAFACNNRNVLSVALDTSINFLKPVNPGDTLIFDVQAIKSNIPGTIITANIFVDGMLLESNRKTTECEDGTCPIELAPGLQMKKVIE